MADAIRFELSDGGDEPFILSYSWAAVAKIQSLVRATSNSNSCRGTPTA
jgi:hypothetical protein